ncbi:MAG: O-antigen ligase family protein [Actinobacteria bacterium]|nr:O-antigen ligase family protein [Actinomycetota bacterium]
MNLLKEYRESPVYLKTIILVFISIPLWWYLGLEQFIFPAAAVVILPIYLYRSRKELKVPLASIPLLVFLIIYAVSGFFVAERIRYFVYAFQFIQYISVTIIFIVIIKKINKKKHFDLLVWTLFIILFIITLLGALAFLIRLDLRFDTPLSRIMPEIFRDSHFLRRTLFKSIIEPDSLIFNIVYTRLTSFFQYANPYAQAIIVLIPLTFYLNSTVSGYKRYKNILRALLFFGLFLMGFNLVFTTSRVAMASLVAGFLWWLVFWVKWPARSKRNLSIFIAAVVLLVVIAVFLIFYTDIIYARKDSAQDRMLIYTKTFESWQDRPLFGWGTSRNIKDVFPEVIVWKDFPPLGSHSTYLDILYRQGAFGLAAYIWFNAIIIFYISRSFRLLKGSMDRSYFNLMGFASWGFVATFIASITHMLDVDSVAMHISWINISIIAAVALLIRKGSQQDIIRS